MDVACLTVPNFLVALARREHPELARRAVIVGGAPEEHAAVTACSQEAAAAGVTIGTTLRRALALCPNAVFLPVQEGFARAEAAILNELVRERSPLVEVVSPGHLHFEIRGLARLAGLPEEEYLAELHEGIAVRTRLPVQIGAAKTVFVAHVAAVTGRTANDEPRTTPGASSRAGIHDPRLAIHDSAGRTVNDEPRTTPGASSRAGIHDPRLAIHNSAGRTANDEPRTTPGARSRAGIHDPRLAIHDSAGRTVNDEPRTALGVSSRAGAERRSPFDVRHFNGHAVLVPSGEERAFLAAAPVEVLPVDPVMHTRLRLFGLKLVGQVAEIPVSAMQAQFGQDGARTRALARGEDTSRIVPQREEIEVTEEIELPAPAATSEPLVAGTEALLQRALANEDVRGQTVRKVEWWLALESGEQVGRRVVFREPTNDARRMLFVLRSKIERLELGAAAVGLGVRLSGLCSEYAHQANLWQLGPRRQRELDEAIEQLNTRAGDPQVYRVVEVQPWSRIPERQVALVAYGS